MTDYIQTIRKKIGHEKLLIPTVDCLIINDKDELLLQLRADNTFWGMVGGMLELHETLKEGLTREIHEETGLRVQDPVLFGVYSGPRFEVTYPNDDQLSPVKNVFLMKKFTGTLQKDEESKQLQFFSLQNLPENIHPTHKIIIDDYRKYKEGKITLPIIL